MLLRQDNADLRLTPIGYDLGLVDKERLDLMHKKYSSVGSLTTFLLETSVAPNEINDYLISVGSTKISQKRKLAEILTRPQVSLSSLLKFVPRETYLFNFPLPLSHAYLPYQPEVEESANISSEIIVKEVIESTEISIKYRGYIEREKRIADKILKLEDIRIPENFDYNNLKSISTESRHKLIKHKPTTISQASRIPGVSPADISVLLVYFGR
ncbi:MAG: hypothetical protein PHE99_08520 [Bacteroidales bacterium]|nr:hypothetical protein [Bacteroidales bacterium]